MGVYVISTSPNTSLYQKFRALFVRYLLSTTMGVYVIAFMCINFLFYLACLP